MRRRQLFRRRGKFGRVGFRLGLGLGLSRGSGGLAQRRLHRRDRGANVDAHGRLALRQTVEDGIRHQVAVELQGASGVIITGDWVSDALGIAIGVEDRHHRDVELARFLDGDGFLVGVDHEHQVRNPAHVFDSTQRKLELVALSVELQEFLLGGAAGLAAVEHAFEFAQARDRLADRAPIGQGAAKPAVVDIVLGAALGPAGHRLGRLALGADEQHPPARRGHFAHLDQRLVQQRHGLREVDDMDVGAGAEDVALHLRIPAVSLVAEVGAGFEQLTHSEFG